MKKFYVSPVATEVNFEAEHILALSIEFKDNDDSLVDTEEAGGQLTSGNRGEWGNLWK